MTTAPSRFPSLEEFLQLPETKPASEYIDGQIVQKPMPKSRHSRLQGRLGWLIDPDDRSVLILHPKQEPELCGDSDRLPVLPQIPLELTASQLFDWLKMSSSC